ncbi:Anthranilate phosphoribosyltransferase [hydrothermal vent metagenome]|uniref:anthranilate phosphoribosyltransferase n=1 Tax=hydrothermal vent metagenome TaxID=652676 RepID=A0A3B0UCZ0_9ZZZZ
MPITTALNLLRDNKDLNQMQMDAALGEIMDGKASEAQTGAFLMGLCTKGETASEIGSAVALLRKKMVPVEAPANAMDIVGTGGDGMGTYNISTASSIIVAAAGIPVAKHGNKALSSKSGSSEALQALGVKLDLDPVGISRCINEAGIGFMFAPNHHPAMRHVGPTRAKMGIRTMFNLLGPQCNPAGVKRYLLGVYGPEWVKPVAQALLANGVEMAWVVHGSDGLDEITSTGSTKVVAVENGALREFEVCPKDVGIELSNPDDLVGGDPAHNAKAIIELFAGKSGAYRDIVLMNAGAALYIGGKTKSFANGVELAAQTIDSGAATKTLARLVEVSNG